MSDHAPLAIVAHNHHYRLLVPYRRINLAGVEQEGAVAHNDEHPFIRLCCFDAYGEGYAASQMTQRTAVRVDVAAREVGMVKRRYMGMNVPAIHHDVRVIT